MDPSLSRIIAAARAAHRDNHPPLPPDEVFASVAASVKAHMAAFDASHDFAHVLRVTALAQLITAAEETGRRASVVVVDDDKPLSWTVVLLAALLHDVTDKKYTASANLAAMLASAAVTDPATVAAVLAVVDAVSYSAERRDPARVRAVLAAHPELAPVQDADRLDALGAVGIARAFVFGAARAAREPMQRSREHMTDKLDKLESMMKTETGKRLAKERTRRVLDYCRWWDEECAILQE